MNKPEVVTEDGEIVEAGSGAALAAIDSNMATSLARVEIDQQVATAKQFPRSVTRAINNILSLATIDDAAAEECMYALPRGGKPITGPSIRLAEIVAGQWGNCRVSARIVDLNRIEKYVEAEGTFHDLETNAASKATVRRRIVDKRGRLFNDDMIIVTGNAACSIARRNAILAGVPKAVWRKAYERAEAVVAGDVQALAKTRELAVKAFAVYGVKPEQVFESLGIAGEDEVKLEHIPVLRGMFAAIKNGEATIEEMFAPPVAGRDPAAARKNLNESLDALAKEPEPSTDTVSAGPPPADAGPASADPPTAESGAGNMPADDARRLQAHRAGLAARRDDQRRYVPAEWRDERDAWLEGFDSLDPKGEPA